MGKTFIFKFGLFHKENNDNGKPVGVDGKTIKLVGTDKETFDKISKECNLYIDSYTCERITGILESAVA